MIKFLLKISLLYGATKWILKEIKTSNMSNRSHPRKKSKGKSPKKRNLQ